MFSWSKFRGTLEGKGRYEPPCWRGSRGSRGLVLTAMVTVLYVVELHDCCVGDYRRFFGGIE